MNIHYIKKQISDAFERDKSYRDCKHKLGNGKISLGLCPKCGCRNSFKFVLTGVCAYCTYDANTNNYLEEE